MGDGDPGRVPPSEWTDDEWMRLIVELRPDAPCEAASQLVYQWRSAAAGGGEHGPSHL